jgi:hypothetical protein
LDGQLSCAAAGDPLEVTTTSARTAKGRSM